jgi:hypothetical protein
MSKDTLKVSDVEAYLDKGIDVWVNIWKNALSDEEKASANVRVDTFQAVRQSLVGSKRNIQL